MNKPTRIKMILPILLLLIALLAFLPVSASAATTGTITASVNHLDEGTTLQLSTNMTGTVTWTSSNSSIASVTSTGYVSGKQAGQVTITASCSGYTSASIVLYVTVPDGLYYIKNASSGFCMQTTTDTTYIYAQITDNTNRIPQLWKITHISNGNYVIRPIRDLTVALTVNSLGYLSVADAAIADASVSPSMYWKIIKETTGYAIKQNGFDSKTAMPVIESATGVQVKVGSLSSSSTCHWNLEKTQGVFFRDITTMQTVTSTTAAKVIKYDEPVWYYDLGLRYEYYGSPSNYYWNTSSSNIASISGGKVTGNAPGTAVITLNATINGTYYYASFKCNVTPTTAILLAINDEDGNARHTYFDTSSDNLETVVNSKSTTVTTSRFDTCTVDHMVSYLASYDYFIIHTHGNQTGFKIGSSTNLTMSNINEENFSNLDFVLLLTCSTASGYDANHITSGTPVNITEQLVVCGAETAVGFSDITYVSDCNRFANEITRRLFVNGYSVDEAINNNSYFLYIQNMSDICVIAGNENNTYR